jgi:triacylglycerol esterase/lipase EstA (alpha/beta hydrolase family)
MELQRSDGTSISIEERLSKKDKLAIVFAGFSYTNNHPLLYYSKTIALEAGYDVLAIDLEYYRNKGFLLLKDEEQDSYFEKDVQIVRDFLCAYCMNYKELVLIGKSLGTSIIRRLFDSVLISEMSSYVLLTPGSEWKKIIEALETVNSRVLVIGSKKDKLFPIPEREGLKKKRNIEMIELEEGDHSLETGVFEKDVEILKEVMGKIKGFMQTSA